MLNRNCAENKAHKVCIPLNCSISPANPHRDQDYEAFWKPLKLMPTKQKFSSQLHTNMTAATYKHACKENTTENMGWSGYTLYAKVVMLCKNVTYSIPVSSYTSELLKNVDSTIL